MRDDGDVSAADQKLKAANVLRAVCLVFALVPAQIACTPRGPEVCADIIMAAKTVAKLERAIIACFKMGLTIETVRAELEKKAARLMSNQGEIPFFLSRLPPDTEKEEDPFPHETGVSIILSIESPGEIRPYVGFIDLSLKPGGGANWLVLGISDQPI